MDEAEIYRLDVIRKRAVRRLEVIASGNKAEPGETEKLRSTITECETLMQALKEAPDI
jgi:hypothetical protein